LRILELIFLWQLLKNYLGKYFYIGVNQIILLITKILSRFGISSRLLSVDILILKFLNKNNLKKPPLLAGFPKSGNTWVRFVIFNYFNILKNGAKKTLTFDELNSIQYHQLEHAEVGPFVSNYPKLFRTHQNYRKIFNYFKVIYIYRNPLDTLISWYYYHKKRISPFRNYPRKVKKKLYDINYFVIYELYKWIRHYKLNINNCTLLLNYEKLRVNPFKEYSKVIRLIDKGINDEALRNSIELSSFDNISKMAKDTNQQYGMGDRQTFKGVFTRSGRSGQYLNELKPEIINLARLILKLNNINIKL